MHHGHVEELLGNGEMGACGVPDDSNSQSGGAFAELLLKTFPFFVHPENAVAVMVELFLACFSSWIDVFVELIAVGASPVIASKGADV